MSLRGKILFYALALAMLSAIASTAQSGRTTPRPRPSDDDTERVATEEIKINVAAFDRSGKFYSGVKPEDLVISEDGVLHQAASVRKIPASVLIVLDTGGEDRQAKDYKTTKETAKALVSALLPDDTIGVIEYNDDARVVVEWTNNRDLVKSEIDKKLTIGRRSQFVKALGLATEFFEKSNLENRHLVLVTDGLDSQSDDSNRAAAIKALLSTDVNVHIFSYTKMEQMIVSQRIRSVQGGGTKRTELPAGAEAPGQGRTQTSPIMTVNLDRAMIRKIRERRENLEKSEKALTDLAKNTNGVLYLPDSRSEMIEKAFDLASSIDANYVVTYVPKRPLADVRIVEERIIEITSRRQGLDVLATRKLVVEPARR
jgi:hypothetical protein